MHEPPIFPSEWIFVAPAQEADITRGLQIIQVLRIRPEFPIKELNGPFVLVAAIDGQLLSRALRFERDPRHLEIHADRNDGRHHEHQQQRKSAFASSIRTGGAATSHPATSASSGSVC